MTKNTKNWVEGLISTRRVIDATSTPYPQLPIDRSKTLKNVGLLIIETLENLFLHPTSSQERERER